MLSTNVYATAATRSIFDGGPVVVIPCVKTQAVHRLAAVVAKNLPKDANYVAEVHGDVVILGPKAAVQRLKASEGKERPDLILPLLSDQRADHPSGASHNWFLTPFR